MEENYYYKYNNYHTLKNDDKECCICLTRYFKEKWKLLSCNHYFHENCIQEWFLKKREKQCPYCLQNHSEMRMILNIIKSLSIEISCSDNSMENKNNYC